MSSKLKTSMSIVYQMALGTQHIHNKHIIHHNLKPDNVLVSVLGLDAKIKICDLGIGKQLNEGELCSCYKGSVPYLAPEVLCGDHHDWSVDVHGVGLILYYLISSGKDFFSNERLDHWRSDEILDGHWGYLYTQIDDAESTFASKTDKNSTMYDSIFENIPDLVIGLMSKSFGVDIAENRLTIDEFVNHEAFAEFNTGV